MARDRSTQSQCRILSVRHNKIYLLCLYETPGCEVVLFFLACHFLSSLVVGKRVFW